MDTIKSVLHAHTNAQANNTAGESNEVGEGDSLSLPSSPPQTQQLTLRQVALMADMKNVHSVQLIKLTR